MSRFFIDSLRTAYAKRFVSLLIVGIFLFLTTFSAAAATQTQTTLFDPAGQGSPAIDSKAYVLYDAQSDTFLLGKNQDTQLSPASITKVMTILLALENLQLTDTITVTRDMYKEIPNDYVRLGLVEGEVITVEQALYACLLISANDAAMALAIKMGGSAEQFAAMMNARAVKLGCNSTHFTNPYGYADKENLTTAHDMALILAEALKHDEYTRISTTKYYSMPATNKADARGFKNGNRFISTTTYAYDNYIGGKTGFTNLSGHTIVAGARQNGRTLIGVILGASYSEIRYANLISLFNYGFKTYSTVKIDPAEYENIKKETVAAITSEITGAGYALSISSAEIKLIPYITTTSAQNGQRHTCSIGKTTTALQAGLPRQVLEFPLYREYSAGVKNQVGTLTLTIDNPSILETTTGNAEAATTGFGAKMLRGLLIFLLSAVVVMCLLIFIAIEIKHRKRRQRRRQRLNSINKSGSSLVRINTSKRPNGRTNQDLL